MSSTFRISAIVLLLAFQTTILAEDAMRWAPDLDTAKRAASARNQLVLLHFYADNCPPCRRLEANVFSEASFAEAVEQNYVPVKINANQQPQLAQEFGVDRWPQDVIITASGQVVYRMISPQDQARYTGVLSQVAAKLNPAQDGGAPGVGMIAQAGANTPLANQMDPAIGPQGQQSLPSPQSQVAPQGSRYSSFTAGNPSASQQMASQQPTSPQVAPQQISPQPITPQAGTSRYASLGSAPETAPADSYSRFASTGGEAPAPGQSSAPQSQPDPRKPPAGWAPPQSAMAAQTASPQQNIAPTQNAPPQAAPAEQPQFAMDGYCPVSLVEGMKWQKGDPRWGAVHQGQVYLFSSQVEQQKFLANPNRFSPVMSGIDPVVYLGNGQVVPGDRRFGLTYRGALYLFASEESLQQFWNEPQRYSTMVQQAMAAQNMRR